MSQTADQLNTIEGERGLPSVNDGNRKSNRGKALFFAFMVFFVVVIAILVYFLAGNRAQKTVDPKSVEDTSAIPKRTFTADAKPALPGVATPVPVITAAPGSPAVEAVPTTLPPAPPTIDKSASQLMVVTGGGNKGLLTGLGGSEGAQDAGSGAGQGAGGAMRAGLSQAPAGGAGGGPLAGLLSGTATPPGKATMLKNRNFLLAKGTFINCALQTRLDSTVPGMTSCIVTERVNSDNGRFVLIEKGSTVSGEYQSNMKQGMERIYVLWTRVKTPNGVVVNLDSPGTDALGGAGLPGYVDNHFWQRFGGAMMLSLVDDAARYATENRRNSTVTFDSTSQATTDMASIALQNTINIPPTLYKNQGERVGIYVARDLDFSGVYRADTE